MEMRDNFLRPPAPASKSVPIPAAGDRTGNVTSSSASSASSSSLTLSPPDFLRQVHEACLKRHRPLASQSNPPRPRATRVLLPQVEGPKKAGASPSAAQDPKGKVMQQKRGLLGPSRMQNAAQGQKKVSPTIGLVSSSQDESLLTTPSMLGTITDDHRQNGRQNYQQKSGTYFSVDRQKSSMEVSSSQMASPNVLVEGDLKKDQFYSVGDSQLTSQSAIVGTTIDSRMDSVLTYLHTASLTAGDNFPGDQVAHDQGRSHQVLKIDDAVVEMDVKYDAANLPQRGTDETCNQNHGEPVTRCSIGSSVTAVCRLTEDLAPTVQSIQAPEIVQCDLPMQMPECGIDSSAVVPGGPGHGAQKQLGAAMSHGDCNTNNQQAGNLASGTTDKAVSSAEACLPSQGLSANDQSLSAKDDGASQHNKGGKERRKKNYDADGFCKVNGKLYQKLGKIGSGGSSEVFKVISAECSIYALKKIKLKGLEYSNAYGFCQEIKYLNKLKGKSNIIQLIDYEVTDKTLLQDSPKNGRIKEEHYIYMVLEYGEIDLANMVAQKWEKGNSSNMKIDENWLRFYWQQMLEAVNTIHEERIVHSDLKPANFLLVRGALKLIDFGIAKAIMNDTTNIHRDDAQVVGTLNYMSPEAFMCNEQDTSGNTIKCGRSSDIWSLGCILYQMVYGKTPFADYKAFWAKFKVITDRNHKIKYEPVDNPWLVDLMQRCLAWDRNERWKIPQLLQHPFLVPLVPRVLPPIDQDTCRLLMERVRVHYAHPEVSRLFSELHTVVAKLEKDQCGPATQL